MEENNNEKIVSFHGKVAKMPKNTKAKSSAFTGDKKYITPAIIKEMKTAKKPRNIPASNRYFTYLGNIRFVSVFRFSPDITG